MNEKQWLASREPEALLLHLWHAKTDLRKLRLCAIARCQPVLHLLQSDLHREALDVALHYAQGEVEFAELARVSHLLLNYPADPTDRSDDWRDTAESQMRQAVGNARWAVRLATLPRRAEGIIQGVQGVLRAVELTGGKVQQTAGLLCDSIRDIIGNPFHVPAIDPAWLQHGDGRARKLAKTIDASGRYEDLPLLADALEEAGCKEDSILAHCRGPGPHLPGCWVPELLLEKTDAICQPRPDDQKALRESLDRSLQELWSRFPEPRPLVSPQDAYQKDLLYGLLLIERWPDREQTRREDFFGTIAGYDPWCNTVALTCSDGRHIAVDLGCLHPNTDRVAFGQQDGNAIIPDYFAFCVDLTRDLGQKGQEMSIHPQSRDKAIAHLTREEV
jgi:hypothetical protein